MLWFRFYSAILDSYTVMTLPKELRWDFVATLCVASKNEQRGYLPIDGKVAFLMKETLESWLIIKEKLLDAGLITQTEKGIVIIGWDEKQYQSDNSTQRVKKHREQNDKCNVTETLHGRYSNAPDTETDIEADTDSDTDSEADPDGDTEAEAPPLVDENPLDKPPKQKVYKFTLADIEREDLQTFGYLHPELKDIQIGKPVDELTWLAGRVIKYKRGQLIQGVPFIEALARAAKNLQSEDWFLKSGGLYWLLDVKAGKYNGENACVRIGKYMKPAQKRDGPQAKESVSDYIQKRVQNYMEKRR